MRNDLVELLWSYPAEGDSDVPTDVQLQVVLSAKLLGSDWHATLNGEPISRSADGAFPLDPLEPDTDYTFRIEGRQPRPTLVELNVMEVHFRTGSASAFTAQVPELVGPSSAEASRTGLCQEVDARYVCRDTAASDIREIELDEPNAVAWLDDAGNVWPRGCYPRVDLVLAQARCFAMHAVSANGQVSEPTLFCPEAAITSVRSGAHGLSRAPGSHSMCTVAAVGGATRTRIAWPTSMLAVALTLRRCWRRIRAGARTV